MSMNVSRRSSLMDSSSKPESFNMRSKSAFGVLARTRRVRGVSPLPFAAGAGEIGAAGAAAARPVRGQAIPIRARTRCV